LLAFGGMDGLTEGVTYTAVRIDNHPILGLNVVLDEITRKEIGGHHVCGFSLRRFRRLELPECLTSILTSVPLVIIGEPQ
jgi:hypothetical protein